MAVTHRSVTITIDFDDLTRVTTASVYQMGTGNRPRLLLRKSTSDEFDNADIEAVAHLADSLSRRWMTKLGTGQRAMF